MADRKSEIKGILLELGLTSLYIGLTFMITLLIMW